MASRPSVINLGDPLMCPHCGKSGWLMRKTPDGLMVAHKSEWRKVKSMATGKLIDAEVFADGCSPYGKIGADSALRPAVRKLPRQGNQQCPRNPTELVVTQPATSESEGDLF